MNFDLHIGISKSIKSSYNCGTLQDRKGQWVSSGHNQLKLIVADLLLCRFRSMAPMYYRRANAAMIVYDVTRESTFEEAREWVKGQWAIIARVLDCVHLSMAVRQVAG